jgi:phosphatidylethanolamine/phosphatidyl-N-methylethanolamine N-methyltransferase
MDSASIVAAYKRYARNYDLIFGCILNPGRRLVVEKMKCLRGQKVLEVGVGTGLSLPFYPEYTAVVGIDLSTHMLARAHKRVSSNGLCKAALSLMDAQIMSFAEGSFDKVVAMYVATVVPDPQAMVSEMK